MTLSTAASALVGRDHELDWLERRLQDALEGRPQLVLVSGEAGIGKTRLLQELQTVARQCRVEVCAGRCSEDLAQPYQPFLDGVFPRLLADDGGAAGAADAEVLKGFLRSHLDDVVGVDAPALPVDHNRIRVFGAVARATVRLAQRGPVLLVVDDLHWADRASLDLFAQIGFTIADAVDAGPLPLIVVGAHRPVEPGQHLALLLARLQPERVCHTLALSGLAESAVEALLAALDGSVPPHQLVATMSRATQGNPLFIQQALYRLREQGVDGAPPTGPTDPSALPFPEQLVGAIAARVQGLGAPCRRVLTLGALLGDRFPLDVLCAVAAVGAAELARWLDEAVRHRLLLADGREYAFPHPLIRHAIAAEAPAAQRQTLHRDIAETLERLYAPHAEAHAIELAHHWIGAQSSADPTKLVAAARQAGDQAFSLYAWSDAARFYDTAVATATAVGGVDDRERAELHYRAGIAHYRDMSPTPSLEHHEKAIAAYRAANDLHGLALALVSQARLQLTLAAIPYGTLLDVHALEEVLTALGSAAPKLRGHIWQILSEVHWTARQSAPAIEMAQRALELGTAAHDDVLCAEACNALALAQLQALQVHAALATWHRELEIARRTNDPWVQGWPLQRIPMPLLWLGRIDDAERAAIEACRWTRMTLDWAEYSLGLTCMATVAAVRGDFAAAEAAGYEVMQMVRRSRYPWGGALTVQTLAAVRCWQGTWADAGDVIEMLATSGRVFDDAGGVVQVIAWVFRELLSAHAGTSQGTPDQLASSLLAVTADAGTDLNFAAVLCALVEIADCLDYPPLAGPPYESLTRVAAEGVLVTTGWVFLLPRVLGVAATLSRQWDRAEAHFRAALDVAAAAGARPEVGRVCLDYARMVMGRHGAGDEVQAAELLRQAAAVFDEFGMRPFAARAAQRAQALGVSLAPSLATPRLTPRETEILVRLARTQSDATIAEELLLRPETVTAYVDGICRTLGVGSREAARTYAFEHGLTSQAPRARRAAAGDVAPASPFRALPSARPVTILFTDMVDSTVLIDRLGDIRAQEILRAHNAIIRGCLRRQRGEEIKHTGDGVMASFPSATAAVACAVAIQQAIAAHNQQHPAEAIRVRIGLNAGEPIAEEGQLFGTAVNIAARLCAHAGAGQILVSDVVRRLVADKGLQLLERGEVALKGFSGRFRVFEVLW